ncbi:MAG: T9SS type A sorting domain-containing protein [Melioribacteraceae bacterium]|nr:T9SS type A sorting domain-containing protein [Melioribacteraceae bacterium]
MSNSTKYHSWHMGFLTIFMLLISFPIYAQLGINEIGSFEQTDPSYWHKAENGATLEWASDEFITLGKSLKITKGTTTEAAMWESENMCDIWSEKHFKDVDIKLGAKIKTDGVNVNPATEDEKWYLSYEFYDSAGVMIGEVKLPVDQSAASMDWYADTNAVGETILPRDSWTTIIKFVGGKDAVGTVWADEFMLQGRGGAWAGGIWNETVGMPEGWIYWLPRQNDVISDGYGNTRITSEESYHGEYSLKFDMLEGTHDGFIGTRFYALNDVETGDKIRISVWIKGENLHPDSVSVVGDQWSVAITPIFHNSLGGNEGFKDVWASDIPLKFPNATSFDWTQFYVDVPVAENSKSLDVRLHPLGRFKGTVWMDGLTVEKLDIPTLNEIGSFEQTDPSYWHKVENGATLEWASDEFITLGKSLKITKEVTSEAAMWESENMCDIWSEKHFKDVDIKLGAKIKTDGVNVNPATEDEKWYLSYEFYDSAGVMIGEVKLPVDQSAASMDWYADTNAVGETILPRDSWTTIIKFVGGKDAVGTVWADEFMLQGRGGAWAGGIWNETVGMPEGWIYWLPRQNDVISDGYGNTRITSEESYHGEYSLKFDMLEGTHDGFVGTRFYALNSPASSSLSKSGPGDIAMMSNIDVGDILRISVWIKGENLHPDSVSVVGDQWSVAITPIFHNSLGGNEGFKDVWASDIPLKFPNATSFDWTQFYVDVPVAENSKSLDVRLHPLGRFKGTVWMDALEVENIGSTTDVANEILPFDYKLSQNYPNPFNPSTKISYALPKASFVTLKIFNMLGQEVKTLVSSEQNAGVNIIQWNGNNNFGSKVSSGTYIYTLKAGDFYQARKMILLK